MVRPTECIRVSDAESARERETGKDWRRAWRTRSSGSKRDADAGLRSVAGRGVRAGAHQGAVRAHFGGGGIHRGQGVFVLVQAVLAETNFSARS